ncbi:MAG: succinylglutamate desuccinylase/aspartoacylase family protein, partial [Candidatus Sericytochromatia bacterium]
MTAMKRVVIVGGTHGNELGGIYLHKLWKSPPAAWNDYPFQVETCLGNPGAAAVCRRYLDQDLNRSFVQSDLANPDLAAYEAQRAKVLASRLGDTDFLFDLHNTTANMGVCLILSRAQALEDPLTRQLCAHLSQDPIVRVYHNPDAPAQSP